MTGFENFDPEFASPVQWAAMYRACRLQVVPGYIPGEPKDGPNWKRPKLPEWKALQESLIPDAEFARLYGPNGEHANRDNMGILTGPCSDNRFIIDLDTYKNPQAAQWWSGVLAVHNNNMEPETCKQRTGGGGRQLVFSAPPDWHAPTNRTSIGVDIRGAAGFAVMPPSLHDTGNHYAWEPGCAPWEAEIAAAPEWLLEAVEQLVERYGGDSGGARAERTPSPGSDYDAFGNHRDGREEYMRDLIWAAVVGWYRECPIGPPPPAESAAKMGQTWLDYERNTRSRLPAEEGVSNAELLEREGRGHTAFANKWRRAIKKWDGKVREEAAKEKPRTNGQAHATGGGGGAGTVEEEHEDELAKPSIADIPGYDVDWTRPDGLLGTMVDWTMASSRQPNRPLAVIAAIATLSAVCGRHLYGPTGSALLLYLISLAGTAVGKDRPLSAPGEILHAAGLGHIHTTGKMFSISAIEQMMIAHPCCVAVVDEIGASLFARMTHKGSNANEQGIRSVLLELWSREDGKSPFNTTRRALQEKVNTPTMAIPRPNLTLFGASTPDAFWESITGGSVKDGFLNRFLICYAAPRGAAQKVSRQARKVPQEIIDGLRALVPELVGFGFGDDVVDIFDIKAELDGLVRWVPWENDAVEARSDELAKQIMNVIDNNPEERDLVGRIAEYAIRLASLHAVSRAGLEAKVTMADFLYGASWSIQSALALIDGAATRMASTEHGTRLNLVRNTFKEKTKDGFLSRRKLYRTLCNASPYELETAIDHLIRAGQVIEDTKATGGRPSPGWRWVGKL